MKHTFFLFTALFALGLHADGPLAARAKELLAADPDARVIAGEDGWLFLASELRHLARGTDWIHPATPPEPAHADPLPALRLLKRQLDELGIPLIVVPVPAKAAIQTDALPGGPLPPPQRPAPFVARLQEEGFHTVDLRSLFAEAKHVTQVYCKTDTHWSPRGAELAAEHVARRVRDVANLEGIPTIELESQGFENITFQGDLTEAGDPTETLMARRVQRTDGEDIRQETSPILLLGDSHTYVFSDGGDMHARDSGFLEHLALELSLPIDRMANRGSASTPPRMSLFRKASRDMDWLENKRAVLYVFTARELTESLNGWRELPLAPQFR
jgi:alginate O-acetyltransferase complex protein AlgJ